MVGVALLYQVRGLALLRQISRHYSNRTADSEEVDALEEKCERMEEEMAQLRYVGVVRFVGG